MEVADLLPPEAILSSVKATSPKQAVKEIGRRAAKIYQLDCRVVTDQLLERERLGSTAIGGGVAIPHAHLCGLDRIVGLFARLDTPVDFEAPDGLAVDLLFTLLAPEQAGAYHLRALARVSRLMRVEETRQKLRAPGNEKALYALLTETPASPRTIRSQRLSSAIFARRA